MAEKDLFKVRGRKCPECGSETIFRDTEATFCGDCGNVIEKTGIVDAMIDEQLNLEVGKIYSAQNLEDVVREKYGDFFFFINALLSSDRMQPHFKVLPKVVNNKAF
ncbi:MAG: TFIIB-type zinc ribbon-containing protein [Candidatus Bathyarchaeota archaeon]|nr:TFIIB-type zinc ribbon-containing protein [Candidatus Bathyarchaeota archaeon]